MQRHLTILAWLLLIIYIFLLSSSHHETPSTVLFQRRLPTGLGDRILVLVGAAAAAKSVNPKTTLLYHWFNERRDRNYSAELVEQALTLPSSIKIYSSNAPQTATEVWDDTVWGKGRLPPAEGYDCVPELVPKTYARLQIDANLFAQRYQELGLSLMNHVPVNQEYIVVHVRGGDKRERFGHCLDKSMLSSLPFKIRVVTDDVRLAKSLVAGTITVRSRNLFHDLEIIMGASGIIMHSPAGWSSFSAMGAFFRNIPVLTTAQDPWRLDMFKKQGALLHRWFRCDQILDFKQSVLRRAQPYTE